MAEQKALNEKLLRLAPETGLPLVVTNDLHYVHELQADAQDVLLCVGTGNNIDTPNRMKFERPRLLAEVGRPDGRALPRSARSDPEYPPDLRDGLDSSCHSATSGSRTSRCPTARPPRAGSARSAKRGCCGDTASVTPELQARLDYELGVILSMGYAGYFLIVADFIALRPRAADPDDLPGQRAGLHRDLHARDHAGRPDRLRAAVRALPQPRPGDDARYRRRLRGRPARRGHRLRHPQVRQPTTSPRSSRSARCSPGRRSATSAAC